MKSCLDSGVERRPRLNNNLNAREIPLERAPKVLRLAPRRAVINRRRSNRRQSLESRSPRATDLLFDQLFLTSKYDPRFALILFNHSADANLLTLERGFQRPEFASVFPPDDCGKILVWVILVEAYECRLPMSVSRIDCDRDNAANGRVLADVIFGLCCRELVGRNGFGCWCWCGNRS